MVDWILAAPSRLDLDLNRAGDSLHQAHRKLLVWACLGMDVEEGLCCVFLVAQSCCSSLGPSSRESHSRRDSKSLCLRKEARMMSQHLRLWLGEGREGQDGLPSQQLHPSFPRHPGQSAA